MDSQDDFEARFARWQASYQKHLQMLTDFFRWQKGYTQQLALWRQKHKAFHDGHKDVEQIQREHAERREPLFRKE